MVNENVHDEGLITVDIIYKKKVIEMDLDNDGYLIIPGHKVKIITILSSNLVNYVGKSNKYQNALFLVSVFNH